MKSVNEVIKFLKQSKEPLTANQLRNKIEGSEILKDYIFDEIFNQRLVKIDNNKNLILI